MGDDLEVVVVDNSPHHEVARTLGRSHRQGTLPVTFIANENRGFGHGNNVGVQNTAGEFLLLLNPDTELTEPLFKFAIDAFRKDESLGAFGVQHRGRGGERRMSFYWIDRIGVRAAIAIKVANAVGMFRGGSMFTSAAALFLRRDSFTTAGGFDEQMFLYNEERDFFKRILKSGYTTDYFSDRSIVHLEGGGSGPSLASQDHRLESLRYYCRKYNLDYLSYLRADLRVAKFGLLWRTLRRGEGVEYGRARIQHLEEALSVAAAERSRVV